MANYTLIGSIRSPFVRIIRLFFVAHGIPYEFKVIDYLEVEKDAEYLAKINPINKIPVLMIDDQQLFDSRVIYNYLAKKHKTPVLTLDEENYLSAIYSLLDVSANLFLYKRGGLDLEAPNWYVQRQKERIPENLKYILPWAKALDPNKPADWNFASMTLFTYLYWAEKREMVDLAPYPDLKAFMQRFENKPGLNETKF